jgi:hypothetical protein
MATRQTLPSFLAWRIAKIPQFIPEPCKESEPKEEWITYHKKQECLKPNLVPGWGYRRHTHRKATRLLILRADNCPQGMRGVPVVRSGVSLFCFLLSHERSTLVSTKSEPYRTGYPYAVPQGVRPQPRLGIRRPESHVRPESAQTRLMSTYLVELLFEAHQTSFAFTNLRPLEPLGSLLS